MEDPKPGPCHVAFEMPVTHPTWNRCLNPWVYALYDSASAHAGLCVILCCFSCEFISFAELVTSSYWSPCTNCTSSESCRQLFTFRAQLGSASFLCLSSIDAHRSFSSLGTGRTYVWNGFWSCGFKICWPLEGENSQCLEGSLMTPSLSLDGGLHFSRGDLDRSKVT